MGYLWSPSQKGFFPLTEEDQFKKAGSWPSDGVEVSESDHDALYPIPDGQIIDTVDGYPAWVAAPLPTQEELVSVAEQQRSALLLEARATISLWQTELQLGIISDEDKASLIVWMNYIKALQAIDTSKAPDITWPDKPE
ncbi:TPA: tail fiber assembly protein [Citrobacter freundii]|uniref:tail fiber assembly protein n=1 Tax=Enterobacter asburiae TaxID=61645 RepID=UPI001A2EDA14|nr:tail fiber assembly protein [Enterobacter asburiae]MCY1149101.1 tail fiber assembly protein [Enterobacter asburiae]MDU4067709.1 tail fiber assembly protein [Enterobacter asburiae]MDU4165895.1 tail fiber assembly protein [Enterobacter asburiae]HAU5704123.1 tail fiber assembly protein [Citrobacter freundii]